jgi:peptidoglycan/xylan/chitin deacetylase (PgdA/CDA1 family)
MIKKLVLSAVTSDPGLMLLAPLRRRCATILMLHRFAVRDLGVRGHDPALLAQHLEYLRRRRYRLIGLMELVAQLDAGIPLQENSVVFTVDDGYADFAAMAAPVFAAYDCPVTVFLVTDFVSGRIWNWFDRVQWAFIHSRRSEIAIDVLGERVSLRWNSKAEAESQRIEMVERLNRISDAVKEGLIREVASMLEVEVPDDVPEQYRAMNWDQVRACARRGATFGPHTMTHPILSQVDMLRAEREISESWRAVRGSTDAAIPVFCYPNGTPADFSTREEEIVSRSGMTAAVSTIDGFLEFSHTGTARQDRFALPRFGYSEEKSRFVQIVSGLEAMRAGLRRR